jgi:hypothetical protein
VAWPGISMPGPRHQLLRIQRCGQIPSCSRTPMASCIRWRARRTWCGSRCRRAASVRVRRSLATVERHARHKVKAGYEAEAREAKAGLWSGAFIAPWDWPNRNKKTEIMGAAKVPAVAQEKLLSSVSSAGAPSPGCDIKGNVNRSGKCIHHQPGGRWYAKINMELNGKRWFCSVKEAEAAGCRATRR